VIRGGAARLQRHKVERDAAKSAGRVTSSRPAAKRQRARAEKQRSTDQPKQAKAQSRSEVMRSSNEIDRLTAQLEQSRACIVDLEAKIDIDPLAELLNRCSFERELKRSFAYGKRYGTSAARQSRNVTQ
jgi:hypothetical protein